MDQKGAEKIIRQRMRPRFFDFSYLTTRAHLKAFLKFKNALRASDTPIQLVDLGCGQKPFAPLLQDLPIENYIGVDFDSGRSKPDVVASVDDLPLEDNSFNAVIASEVLEHTLKLETAVAELRRVAKNSALVYISTPFMFGEHGVPYDFQRITQYKYLDLFKGDEILLLQGTNSNLSTPFFVMNACLESISALKFIPLLLPLVYVFNNVLALCAEATVSSFAFLGRKIFSKRKKWFETLLKCYFYTMPGGYDVLIKIKK
jgi:SAM-dependent methyltransferase